MCPFSVHVLYVLHKEKEQGRVPDYLFSIQHYLLELTRLCKALDHLVGDVSSEIHTKSQCWVRSLHEISQLL